MFGHPGKKLLFKAREFGQWDEWDTKGNLDWHLTENADHGGLPALIRDLDNLYTRELALHQLDSEPQGFDWTDFSDHNQSIVAFQRNGKDASDPVLIVCNFTPVL
jgi:1,4-alpha-glucan branching enzyme